MTGPPGRAEAIWENAVRAGARDRVCYQHIDDSKALPDQYDVITAFDVIHDAVDRHLVAPSLRE
jgi:hypothetical protein